MPTPPLVYEIGKLDEHALQRKGDAGILVSKCEIAGERTWKEFIGSNEATCLVRGTDPKLVVSMTAIAQLSEAGDRVGFALVNNGQRITSLANLDEDIFGHDQSDGLLLIKNPKVSKEETAAPSYDLNTTHYPFTIPQTGDPAALAV